MKMLKKKKSMKKKMIHNIINQVFQNLDCQRDNKIIYKSPSFLGEQV